MQQKMLDAIRIHNKRTSRIRLSSSLFSAQIPSTALPTLLNWWVWNIHSHSRGAFTCVGWQVTLCDPIWQVTSRSSEMGFPWRAISAFTFFYQLFLRSHGFRYVYRNSYTGKTFVVKTRVATRPVFARTSRFSACLSRVPVERLPGRYMSRFWASVLGLLL